ncbi:hypothetical protein SEA_AUSTIN_46 [Gordonia phage Austin]|nr:hypothetical protein SEA_AUSTIN_46 [Gordonia phage Austin]
MSTPAGPYEMNPITGTDSSSYVDFRPKQTAPTEKTAFQVHMEQTAFQKENSARDDAEADARALFGDGDGEPKTAFELESRRGGRAPLGAPESVEPSQPEQTQREQDSDQEKKAEPVTVVKEPKQPTPIPAPKVTPAS